MKVENITEHKIKDKIREMDSVVNQVKKLFNPDGDDTQHDITRANITNILNLAEVKYPVFIDLWKKAYSHNWLPDSVSNMFKDKYDFRSRLKPEEKEAFIQILAFLIYLDSIQTNNLPNIMEKTTSPEIVFFLGRQTADEALHSYSYAYIVKNIATLEEFNELIYAWRKLPVALNRNKYIAELYEKYDAINTDKAYLIVAVANFLLEGLYFYNGFNFFHNLAYRGLMINTNIQISYIKRDENVHCAAFQNILKIIRETKPEIWDEELIKDLFRQAVKWELDFSLTIIGDKIDGMSSQDIEDYTYWLANKRLKEIKIEPIFPERKNPYKHLDMIAAIDNETDNKTNSFEAKNIHYKDPSIFDGWDNI